MHYRVTPRHAVILFQCFPLSLRSLVFTFPAKEVKAHYECVNNYSVVDIAVTAHVIVRFACHEHLVKICNLTAVTRVQPQTIVLSVCFTVLK